MPLSQPSLEVWWGWASQNRKQPCSLQLPATRTPRRNGWVEWEEGEHVPQMSAPWLLSLKGVERQRYLASTTSVGNPSKPRNLARVPSDCLLGSWYPCCKPGPPRVEFCEICSTAFVPVPQLKQEIIRNRNRTFQIYRPLPRTFLAIGRGRLHRHKRSLRQRPTPQCCEPSFWFLSSCAFSCPCPLQLLAAATCHKATASKRSTKHLSGSTCANNKNISKHIKTSQISEKWTSRMRLPVSVETSLLVVHMSSCAASAAHW